MSAEFFSRRKLESARQFRLTANKAAVGGVSKLMRKPRVLFLAPHLDDSGFESRYVSHLLRRLKDSGERIFVLRPGAGLSGGIRYFLSLLRRVPRCDIVQLNYCSAGSFMLEMAPALVLARFFGRASLLYALASDCEALLYRWPYLAGALLRMTTLNLAPDRYLRELFAQSGATTLTAPPLPRRPRRKQQTQRKVQPRILVTSPLTELYNPRSALLAFAHTKEKYPRTEITFCGDGSLRAGLEEAVRSLKISGVEFGSCSSENARDELYSDHDVFLHTPSYDTSHLALREALDAGLPVVTTGAGGVAEIVRDRVGAHVVEADNHVALAERIIVLVENPQQAAALAAAGKLCARPAESQNLAKLWRQIYDTILKARTGPGPDMSIELEPAGR